ncbi:MAG: quinonprotein alcohol dehydrogenase, partial [Planctomycetes bacterium]|nr:quinonprotein alcohol dehydrogenase [Planctomycetota bacterium]
NQFRGPHGDGSARNIDGKLPTTFSEGSPEIVWKTPVEGWAWSSPVVWGKQIWLTNAPNVQNLDQGQSRLERPIELSAVGLDLESGAIVHRIKLFEIETPQYTDPTNSYASPTPCIEEGRVYVHFGSYGTACLDTNSGQVIWERRDLNCNHHRGSGSSPVIHGNLIYLTLDGFDRQFVVALDKKTGKTVWSQDRDIDYKTQDGDAKKAYSTPTVIRVNEQGPGSEQDILISPSAMATIAYSAKSGRPVWSVSHGGMNAAARPLFGNGLIYISTGDGPIPLLAVRPEGSGDITKNIVWKSNKSVPKRPSQVLAGELMFMMNDGGVASCLDALTGKEIWTKRHEGEYWSSPLYADGLIYCFSQRG